jgi:hypothetical protein
MPRLEKINNFLEKWVKIRYTILIVFVSLAYTYFFPNSITKSKMQVGRLLMDYSQMSQEQLYKKIFAEISKHKKCDSKCEESIKQLIFYNDAFLKNSPEVIAEFKIKPMLEIKYKDMYLVDLFKTSDKCDLECKNQLTKVNELIHKMSKLRDKLPPHNLLIITKNPVIDIISYEK